MANNFYKIHKGVSYAPQSSTPSNPVDGDVYYDSTLNKFRAYENGSWTDLINSSVGGINYIDNFGAEVDTLGWNTYDNGAVAIPTDGSSGTSSNLTIARSTSASEILRDTASFKLSKAASDSQGEGASYNFSIHPRDKNSSIEVYFDFKNLDTNFVNGDVKIFVYDIDNSILLGSISNDTDGDVLLNNNDGSTFSGTFASTDSLNYRLIFHVTSTNASAWDLMFDNVRVGPEQFIGITYQNQEVVDLTSSGAFTSGSILVSRTGNMVSISIISTLNFSSTSNAVSAVGILPSWAIPDSPYTNVARQGNVFVSQFTVYDDGSVGVSFIDWTGTNTATTSVDNGTISYPVSNLTNVISNNKLSQQTIHCKNTNGLATGTIDNTFSNITVFNGVLEDDFNIYNASTGEITVPKTGWYRMTARLEIQSTQTTNTGTAVVLSRNGNTFATGAQNSEFTGGGSILNTKYPEVTGTVYAEKGDILTVRPYCNGTTPIYTAGLGGSSFYLESLPDYSTLGVYNQTQPEYITTTSSFRDTSGLDNVYYQLVGNSITLSPGEWIIHGSVNFTNTGADPQYTNMISLWASTNGTDTLTTPSVIPSPDVDTTGISLNNSSATVNQWQSVMPTFRKTVTSNETIYIVPYAKMSAPANGRIFVTIYAERIK